MTDHNTAPPPDSDPLHLAPHSVEAEEAVLGSLLMDPTELHKVAAFLTADDFFIVRHGWIYDAMLALRGRGDAIDELTVTDELKRAGRLEEVGGPSYIAYLFNSTPTAIHAETYAHIVERAAIRRRLLSVAGEIAQLAHDEEKDIDAVTTGAEGVLLPVTARRQARMLKPMRLAVSDYFERIEALRADNRDAWGLPTGFTDLDKLLGGLMRDDLIIVAGRPGMGKSSWLLSLVLNLLALAPDARPAFYSLEMSAEQVMQRAYAIQSGIDAQALRLGKVDDVGWKRFVDATSVLANLKGYISDEANVTLSAIRAHAMSVRPDLIIVDYAGLMSVPEAGRNASRVEQNTVLSRALKELAREFHIPVLVAHQLNRAVEQRQDKRPMLSDLRESGSWEQDADAVLFLYRDDVYNEASERPNEADVILAKHRHGPTGTVPLFFQKELTRFTNLKRSHIDLRQLSPASMPNYSPAMPVEWKTRSADNARPYADPPDEDDAATA